MNIVRTKAHSTTHSPASLLEAGRPLTLASVADGAEGFVLADLARAIAAQPNAPPTSLLVVCRDGARMAQLTRGLAFFAPDVATLEFPAWDCQPYDRASPHPGIVAQRMTALSRLAHLKAQSGPQSRPSVLLTTVNAVVQRVPARARWSPGRRSPPRPATCWPWTGSCAGSSSTDTCVPRRCAKPANMRCAAASSTCSRRASTTLVRLDFFGDTLEIDPNLRSRDPAQQRYVARGIRSRAGDRVPAHHRDHPALPHRLCASLRGHHPGRPCSTRR